MENVMLVGYIVAAAIVFGWTLGMLWVLYQIARGK